MIGGVVPLGSENARLHLDAPIVSQRDQPTIAHFPPNTDLRMGWADACSLGRLASESILSFDTRQRHIVLGNLPHRNLRQQDCSSMTETSHNYKCHTPRYLHIDNAKEFILQEMVDFSSDKSLFCNHWTPTTTPCRLALKVLLAAQSNIAESRSCAPICPPVYGKMPMSTLRARKIFYGQNVTHMLSSQLLTIACNLPLQAHTKLW